MFSRRIFGRRVRWVLLGLGLLLLAAPIGDARDLLFANFGLWSSTRKYFDPFEFDRALGRVVLFLGWCCIARGLGGDRRPENAAAGSLARLSFRLRWLPVPILATMGLYVALAYHEASAQLLVVDVANPPPGTKLRVGGQNEVSRHHKNRYAEAVEYLFGVRLPDEGWLATFERAHVEYRSEPGQFTLQNWQPQWSRLFISSKDEINKRGLVVFLYLRPCTDGLDAISVGKSSAVNCDNWYEEQGRCLVQNAYYRWGAKQIRVTVDLASLDPESYEGHFPPRFDGTFGGKWPRCGPLNQL